MDNSHLLEDAFVAIAVESDSYPMIHCDKLEIERCVKSTRTGM